MCEMVRISRKEQERLIEIFNEWGFFPVDKPIHLVTYEEYLKYLHLYYKLKAG